MVCPTILPGETGKHGVLFLYRHGGHGVAVVVGTGMNTQVGTIAHVINEGGKPPDPIAEQAGTDRELLGHWRDYHLYRYLPAGAVAVHRTPGDVHDLHQLSGGGDPGRPARRSDYCAGHWGAAYGTEPGHCKEKLPAVETLGVRVGDLLG